MDGFGLQPNRPVMAAEHPRRVDLRQLVDRLPEAAPRGLDFPLLHPATFQPRVGAGRAAATVCAKIRVFR